MGHRRSPDQCQQLNPPDFALSMEPGHLASWTYHWNNASVNATYRLAQKETCPFQLVKPPSEFTQSRARQILQAH